MSQSTSSLILLQALPNLPPPHCYLLADEDDEVSAELLKQIVIVQVQLLGSRPDEAKSMHASKQASVSRYNPCMQTTCMQTHANKQTHACKQHHADALATVYP